MEYFARCDLIFLMRLLHGVVLSREYARYTRVMRLKLTSAREKQEIHLKYILTIGLSCGKILRQENASGEE